MNQTKLQKPLPPKPPRKQKKLKKLLKEAEAIAKGSELGKYAAHAKKPWRESLKEHVGHWIDNIDPLELAAIGTGTIIIHGLILNTPALKQQAISYAPSAILLGAIGVTVQFLEELWRPKQVKLPDPLTDDWKYWVAAFFVAYMLVKNGGQIVGLLDKSMTSIVGLMLA